MSAPTDGSAPTEAGFYWRRAYHYGPRPEWRWEPGEVYRPYGSPADAPLMTNNHGLGNIHWGPRIVPPPDLQDELRRDLGREADPT